MNESAYRIRVCVCASHQLTTLTSSTMERLDVLRMAFFLSLSAYDRSEIDPHIFFRVFVQFLPRFILVFDFKLQYAHRAQRTRIINNNWL